MPATFRGSSFLLTWPQSGFSVDDLLEFLKLKEHASYVLVSSETHEDGNLHRHALVHYSKVIQVGTTFFNFEERHPNVRTVGRKKTDWENVENYVKKDGNFVEWGTPRNTNTSVWSLVCTAATREEAETLIATEKPRDYVINSRQIDYFLDKKFPAKQPSAFVPRPIESFVIPPDLEAWFNENFWYVLLTCTSKRSYSNS